MTLFPVSIEPLHTFRTARIIALVANTKMYYISLEQIRNFFLETVNIFLESGIKFRVSLVSEDTTFCGGRGVATEWGPAKIQVRSPRMWRLNGAVLRLKTEEPGSLVTAGVAQ
jgi:hypothetical protein